ncbi:MAG TPA: DUF2490 domain-containing protein [Chitinophagales bacterium]|nr:DUF2490 domain-containing protein [Chitinophagales bacterium]
MLQSNKDRKLSQHAKRHPVPAEPGSGSVGYAKGCGNKSGITSEAWPFDATLFSRSTQQWLAAFFPLHSVLLLLFFGCSPVFAQDAYTPQKDFQGLIGLNIEKKLSRSFSVSVFNQYVFNQNLSELGTSFIDIGLTYKLNRNISFGADYRFIKHRNLTNFYESRQMLLADVTYSKGFNKFSLSARVRFQNQYYDQFTGENYKPWSAYNRNKLTLRYKINYYFVPYISGEIFYPLNNTERNGIDRLRTSAGFFYNFNDHLRSEWYYAVSAGFNHKTNNTNYAAGTTLYYRF